MSYANGAVGVLTQSPPIRMIKWLSGSRLKDSLDSSCLQTNEQPLPSFPCNASHQIYTITRVNPIYNEDEPMKSSRCDGQESPRKSISSGYASVTTSTSSCESGSGTECDSKENEKRDKRVAIKRYERRKRQNGNGLIENVLAANYSSIKRRPRKDRSGTSNTANPHLSPIPEGVVDQTIPLPIWPSSHDFPSAIGLHRKAHNGTTDPVNFMYKYNEVLPSPHEVFKHLNDNGLKRNYSHRWNECVCLEFEKHKAISEFDVEDIDGRTTKVTEEVLRDLASLIAQIMHKKSDLEINDILAVVCESVRKSVEALSKGPTHTVKGEFILYSGPLIDNKDDAFSKDIYNSSSSSGADQEYSTSSGDSLPLRFKRCLDNVPFQGAKGNFLHQRESSSSSVESAISLSPSIESSGQQEEVYSEPSRTQENVNDAVKAPCTNDYGSRAFDKLISAKRKISDVNVFKQDQIDGKGSSPLMFKSKKADIVITKKVEHPYYVAMGRPDFTLDLPQAERMMKKIANAKRYRCWCRFTTSTLGLIFFVLSVVVVSLVITKGRKVFGAI